MSWLFVREESVINIIPQDDIGQHIESGECPCEPRMEILETGDTMFVHGAFDGREQFEPDNKVRDN